MARFLQGTLISQCDVTLVLTSIPERHGFHPNNIRILTDDQHIFDSRKNSPTKKHIVSYLYRLSRPSPDAYRSAVGGELVGRGRSTW